MTATSHERLLRLRRLEALFPRAVTASADCPDGARLLAILGDAYGSGGQRGAGDNLEVLTPDELRQVLAVQG